MEYSMNEALTVPSMDAEVNPTSQLVAELERRVVALEAKVAAIPDQKHLEMHITERIKATIPLPAAPSNPTQPPSMKDISVPIPSLDAIVETAKTTWTLLEMVAEFKALFWTLFDRRYHMAWLTRFITITLLVMIMTSQWWVPLAKVDVIGPVLDKIADLLLCLVLFMVLSFETRRYKEWRRGRGI
jgi:hypothetical protein